MVKSLGLFLFFALVTMATQGQSFYDLSFHDMDGNLIETARMAKKKSLFIVLPSNSDDSLNSQLKKFAEQHGGNINIIGLLSSEEGFNSNNKSSVNRRFGSLPIILTEIMTIRKSVGKDQSPLLQWLTDKSKNNLSDKQADKSGVKFFVSETGRLFGVFGRDTSLQSAIIEKLMSIANVK